MCPHMNASLTKADSHVFLYRSVQGVPMCPHTYVFLYDVSLYTSVQERTGMGTHWSFCQGHDTGHMGT